MQKFLSIIILVFVFISVVGSNQPNIQIDRDKNEQKIPDSSFGNFKGINRSTIEPIERTNNLEKEKTFEFYKSDEINNPFLSGGYLEGKSSFSGAKSISDVVDSFLLPNYYNNGSEWDGRYIYIVQSTGSGSAGNVHVFDPEIGLVIDNWTLPFTGNVFGVAFVNGYMYVSDWTNGMIRKVDLISKTLVYSFPAPGDIFIRGITSDGQNIYAAVAGFIDTVYLIDTLGSILNSWYTGSFCDWVMDIAYSKRDSTIWMGNDVTAQIMKVDLKTSNAQLLYAFTPPEVWNIIEGIAFDGSDLWFNTYYGSQIYRIDAGYSRSRFALFQDYEPWGLRSIKDILYANGIPFKVFSTYDMGNVDLSKYTKAIIVNQQSREMGDSLASHKDWWENWINNGGVLEIHGATYIDDSWEGLVLPGNISVVCNAVVLRNILNISSGWHPIINYPYYITDESIDNWNSSSHGYLINLGEHYTIINDEESYPVLAIKRLGKGGIIATMMTLEWGWAGGYSQILENVLKYWQYGVSNNVLFAIAEFDQLWMRNALMERNPEIKNVDYMNAISTIPKLNDFKMYDVVFTLPNFQYADKIAMGDTLAAYVDIGGKVICGTFCWYSYGNNLGGEIMTADYNPFYNPTGWNHFSFANLGWYDVTHPMMNGINTFGEIYRDYLALNPGADTVAKYDDGEYLIGIKTQETKGNNGVVVGFNALPLDSTSYYNWSGQMVSLLGNVINWSASYTGIDDNIISGKGFKIIKISNPVLKDNEWIELIITSPSKINFKIIDITGREVFVRNYDFKTQGIKRIEFNVSNLPSGAYFISVSSDKEKEIRKGIIIR